MTNENGKRASVRNTKTLVPIDPSVSLVLAKTSLVKLDGHASMSSSIQCSIFLLVSFLARSSFKKRAIMENHSVERTGSEKKPRTRVSCNLARCSPKMSANTVDLLSRTTDRWSTITSDSALARLWESCQVPVVERVVQRAAWLDTRVPHALSRYTVRRWLNVVDSWPLLRATDS